MQKRFKINHFILRSGLLVVGLFAFALLIKSTPVNAGTGINKTINFQGRLLNSQGATVPDGFYNIQFKIYQDGDGQTAGDATGSPSGSLKWTESYLNANSKGVKVINGYLSVSLGSITPFGSNIDWNQSTLWLSMNIGGTGASCTPFSSCSPDGEMVPMQPMTTAPYALNSGMLGGLTGDQFVQIANGLQTDASNSETISINKTGTGNILDLQKSSSSVFLISNTGQTTITTTATNALLVRDTTGQGFLSVDTSGGVVNIGVTGAGSSNSTIHIADSSTGIQTVSIGSNNSSSAVTIKAGSGGITLNGDISISSNKNFTQFGTGTFSTGSGANSLNGDTTIASGKNFTQSGGGTFSTGSGANSLNGDTTVATGKNLTVTSGNTSLGGNLDVTGSAALKKGTDYSTGGTTNNANFSNASLIRLTGTTAQTITGISGGRDGYLLTLVNASSNPAILTNNDSNSTFNNRISTGTGASITLPAGGTVTLVYDSSAGLWRAGSATTVNNLQTAYNNSVSSPQITLSSANGGLVVQDASSAIGAALFTVQNNGGGSKYFNVDATTVAINDNLTVSGTINTNTFTSTALTFGGASGTVSSAGNLTIQAGSSNSLILDTAGAGSIALGTGNAITVNVATNNIAHTVNMGSGGTSAQQSINIGSTGNVNSIITLNAGSTGGINANGSLTVNGSVSISGTNSFSTGSGSVALNGDTTLAANKNFTQNGTGTFSTGSGAVALNGDTTIAANKNFTQSGTGTFSTGSGANNLNGDVSIATGKNFTQSGGGTFSTGSGANSLNGDTTIATGKNFTVTNGSSTLGGSLDVTGSAALKKGTDFSTVGTTNNASFGDASLIRLTGATAQTITGIASGRDGYILTLVNAGSNSAILTNNDSNSSVGNRIITGTGTSITLLANTTLTLVYDSSSAVWRAGTVSSINNLQTAYNNSTSPQITLNSTNGGLVVQDASSAIGAALFTVQNNGGGSKYFNVDATTVAINDNLTVSGTYNTNTFTSTSLAFGGATGSISSTGNLTIQAGSSNSLLLDTSGSGTVAIATGNAATVNVATNNVAHTVNIGTGGTSAQQTVNIGSSGNINSSITLNAGSTGGITINGGVTLSANNSFTQSGTGSFSTGSGSVALNGDTTIAANHNFTQSGTGTFSTGSGAVALNGDTTIAANKNFTQNGTGTFSTGSGANSLNGDTTIASGKNFTQSGTGTFSTGSGANSLNGDTTVATGKNLTVTSGNTNLGGNLDVTGSAALKKGADFSTVGTTNNANFANASLIRLTGASAQTITGIANGRDGYVLTLVNAGAAGATITNNDSNSNVGSRILTGTGNSVTVAVNTTITLVYDATSAVWRAGTVGGTNNLQTAYNNSTSSPQITLSSANGGLVVQDASSAIGAALFTVQSNGGSTKYFNIDATTVAINDNLTVSGTYNTNTFTSTSLAFGGATGSVSSTGNLTIQAGSTNALLLDTSGAGTVAIGTGNAATVNVATNNAAHNIHIGDGGTSAQQTITIGSTGNINSSVTINTGSTGGFTVNGVSTINGSVSITGTNSFSTGSGSVALNGDTTIAANHNFTQSGTGTFTTGSGANTLSGDTSIAGAHTFTTGTGAVALNGASTVASGKTFTALGDALFKDSSNSATAFQVQNNSTFNVMAVDTSINHLKVFDGTASQKYVDIYYDDGTNSAIIAASTGTTKIGNGSGDVNINAGASSAVTILGHTSSSWTLDSGNLTLDVTSASTPTLNVGTGAQAKNIFVGNTTGGTAVTIQSGTGGITLTGNTTISANNNFTQNGAGTFSTGTGAVSLNGDTTIAANHNFTQSGTGTFTTGSGANTLSGDTTVAGTHTFTTGAGAVSLNGVSTVASNKTFTALGDAVFKDATNSASAFQVQNNSGAAIFAVDSSSRQVRVYENGGTANYALIFYDTATTTANYTANTGTVAVGAGAGAISVVSGTSSAITITANAASVWKTTAGTLTLQSGTSSDLILNPGSSIISVNGSSVVKLGSAAADPTCTTGAIYYNSSTNLFRGCQNATWATLSSTTQTLQQAYSVSTGGSTPEVKLDSTRGGLDIQDADSTLGGVLFAVRGSNVGGLGTSILNVNSSNSTVNIGTSAASTSLLVLGSDTNSTFNAGTTSNAATVVNGAMFYSSTDHNFLCGTAGSWVTCNGLLYSNTSASSAVNTCTTACTSFNKSVPIPANYCQAGRVIHVIARGVYGVQNVAAQNFALGVYYGTDSATKTNDTPLGTSTTTASVTNLTNVGWKLDTTIICYDTTHMQTEGDLTYSTSNTAATAAQTVLQTDTGTAGTTVTSTSAKNIYLFPAFGASNASNTVTLQQLIVTGN